MKPTTKRLLLLLLALLPAIPLWLYYRTLTGVDGVPVRLDPWPSWPLVVGVGLMLLSAIASNWIIPEERRRTLVWLIAPAAVAALWSTGSDSLPFLKAIPLALGLWFVIATLTVAYWPERKRHP